MFHLLRGWRKKKERETNAEFFVVAFFKHSYEVEGVGHESVYIDLT